MLKTLSNRVIFNSNFFIPVQSSLRSFNYDLLDFCSGQLDSGCYISLSYNSSESNTDSTVSENDSGKLTMNCLSYFGELPLTHDMLLALPVDMITYKAALQLA